MNHISGWLLALPFLAGAVLPLQAGINGQLARQLSSVFAAALISFAVGSLALLLMTLSQREMPGLGALKQLTWWHWSGGLLGAFFIATAAFAGPRIGALLLSGCASVNLERDFDPSRDFAAYRSWNWMGKSLVSPISTNGNTASSAPLAT